MITLEFTRKRVASSLLLICAVLTFSFSLQAEGKEGSKTTIHSPLGKNGAINLWVFVDKIPLPNGEEDLPSTLKKDLLPNESTLAPVGGEKFTFAKHSYQWGVIKLIDGYYELVHDIEKGARPLDYSGAYMFTNLVSAGKETRGSG